MVNVRRRAEARASILEDGRDEVEQVVQSPVVRPVVGDWMRGVRAYGRISGFFSGADRRIDRTGFEDLSRTSAVTQRRTNYPARHDRARWLYVLTDLWPSHLPPHSPRPSERGSQLQPVSHHTHRP